jgi:hypothetical protein
MTIAVTSCRRLVTGTLIACSCAAIAAAQDEIPRIEKTLPNGHVAVQSALGGKYVIGRELKDEYDKLLARARLLKAQIASRDVDETTARREMIELRAQLADTAERIEKTRQLVEVAHVHQREEKIRITLGPERCLLVRAGKVRIVGWDEKDVLCVLNKTVLTNAAAEADVDAEFAAIQLVHRHGKSPDDVGRTADQYRKNVSDAGLEMSTIAQRIFNENIAWYAPLRALQDREVDVLEVKGLTFQEGNQHLSMELNNDEGGVFFSQWRRHVDVTIYVSKCNFVGVRGGRGGLDVDSVDAPLGILGEDDVDYDARSRISNITGDVTVYNLTVHQLENVRGDVTLVRTAFEENSGTTHVGNRRTTYSGDPPSCTLRNISGDLQVQCTQAELQLENVSGAIRVRNDYGATTLVSDAALSDAPHSIVSESGSIDVRIPRGNAETFPLLMLTECGNVSCLATDQQQLATRNYTSFSEPNYARRNWKGFISQDQDLFDSMDRVNKVLTDQLTAAGLHLINRGGSIRFQQTAP